VNTAQEQLEWTVLRQKTPCTPAPIYCSHEPTQQDKQLQSRHHLYMFTANPLLFQVLDKESAIKQLFCNSAPSKRNQFTNFLRHHSVASGWQTVANQNAQFQTTQNVTCMQKSRIKSTCGTKIQWCHFQRSITHIRAHNVKPITSTTIGRHKLTITAQFTCNTATIV